LNAILLAAGLGTRLRPLTLDKPKALVEINGIPMLEHNIRRLQNAGFSHIVINVHHFHDQIRSFLETRNFPGVRIDISDESGLLLDTGGGIKKASLFIQDDTPILVHNADVFTDLDFSKMLDWHKKNQAIATLAVIKRVTSRYLLFDGNYILSGWENKNSGERIISRESNVYNNLAFSGIHIIEPGLPEKFSQTGPFSIIDAYLKLSAQSRIKGFEHSDGIWLDAGNPTTLKSVSDFILTHLHLYQT